MDEHKKGLTYADAGVDIDAGNKAVELMKDSVRASYRPEVIGDAIWAVSEASSPSTRRNTRNRCWFPARTAWARN